MNGPFILAGAGGHALSVIDALLAGGFTPAFIVDDDPAKRDRCIGNVLVRGPLNELTTADLKGYSVVVAIAKNELRQRIAIDLLSRGATLRGVRHPTAIVSPLAKVDPTAHLLAGVIVNAGAVVKAHAVLNTGCIVEHDSKIEEFAHLGPGALLAGAVEVGEGAFVATGAKVCPFVRLGSWSTLGAGAVALRDIAPSSIAVGIPARLLRAKGGK